MRHLLLASACLAALATGQPAAGSHLGAAETAAAIHLDAAQTVAAIHVDPAQIFRDVQVLAADDMEGRLAGSPGSEKARAYLSQRLTEAGVKPIGDSFERPFTF